MSDLYARLKPFDPKRDNAMGVFVCGHQRFDASKWVPVSTEMAVELRRIHQSYYDERSPLAFDVCTLEQAVELGYEPEQKSTANDGGDAPPRDPMAGRNGEASNTSPNRPRKKDA